jgi:hypothetical protein
VFKCNANICFNKKSAPALALSSFTMNVFLPDDGRAVTETCSLAAIKTNQNTYFCCACLKVEIRYSIVPAQPDGQFESLSVIKHSTVLQVFWYASSSIHYSLQNQSFLCCCLSLITTSHISSEKKEKKRGPVNGEMKPAVLHDKPDDYSRDCSDLLFVN